MPSVSAGELARICSFRPPPELEEFVQVAGKNAENLSRSSSGMAGSSAWRQHAALKLEDAEFAIDEVSGRGDSWSGNR